jgi:adhesin/invasin
MSGWKVGANGFEERALDGYDIELGVPLPYMPRTRLYGKILEWTAQTGDFSEKGISYSFEGEFYNGIFLEVGRRHYEESNNENFVAVRVNLIDLIFGPKHKKPFFAKQPYQLASMANHKYDKVRRENLIRKERRVLGNFSVTASGF